MLSPVDAEKVSLILAKTPNPYVWMGTTQHTILAGQPPVGIVESKSYQEMIEKIRFFNGELRLLSDDKAPLTWLGQETDLKFAYYERHLLRCRASALTDLIQLRQSLSSARSVALRYLADYPFEDYSNLNWRGMTDPRLSSDEILECSYLAEAFAYARLHGLDEGFCFDDCQQKYPLLSHSSLSYLATFIDGQLLPLRDGLCGLNATSKEHVKPLLPMLFKEYLPHRQEQTVVDFLIHKMSAEGFKAPFMELILDLQTKPSPESAEKWMLLLDQVLKANALHAMEVVSWLLSDVLTDVIYQSYWQKASLEILLRFVKCPCLLEKDTFLKAYLFACYKDKANLERLIQQCETHQRWHGLQKILESLSRPWVLLLERLKLVPERFNKSIEWIEEWIQSPISILLEDHHCLGVFLEQVIQENRDDATIFLQVLEFEITHHSEIFVHEIISALKRNTFHPPCFELLKRLFEHPKVTTKGVSDLIEHLLTLTPHQIFAAFQSFGVKQLRAWSDHQLLQFFFNLPSMAFEDQALLECLFNRLSGLNNQDVYLRFAQIKNLPRRYLDTLLNHDLDARGLKELITCINFGPALFCKVLTKQGHLLSAEQVSDMIGTLQTQTKRTEDINELREIVALMIELPCSNPFILKKIVELVADYLPTHIPFWERIPSKFNTLDLSDINLSNKARTLSVDLCHIPKSIFKIDLTNTQFGNPSSELLRY